MEITFDSAKDQSNIAKHGISLARAAEWDFLGAATLVDRRRDYGEVRYRSFGRLDGRLYCLAYALTDRACGRSACGRRIGWSGGDMARKRKVIDEDNPEWTKEDFAQALPGAEVLPASVVRKLRGKQKAPTKELISIRLSQDVLGPFRESGPGWQSKVEDALRQWLKRHSV